MIRVKRIYDPSEPEDGDRILVDRLWPRGVSKEKANLKEWPKDLAPSDELRNWYHADLANWEEFRRRYLAELEDKTEELWSLAQRSRSHNVTLLFASRETDRNHALVLQELLGAIAAED